MAIYQNISDKQLGVSKDRRQVVMQPGDTIDLTVQDLIASGFNRTWLRAVVSKSVAELPVEEPAVTESIEAPAIETPAVEVAPEAPVVETPVAETLAVEIAPEAPVVEVAPEAPAVEVAPEAPAVETIDVDAETTESAPEVMVEATQKPAKPGKAKR